MTTVIRIVGIDPGLRRTGWGVIDTIGNSVRFVASGSVTSDGDDPLARRLVDIHDGLDAVLAEYAPDEAAIEQTFVNKDAGATLKLGQARGVALLAPARRGLPVAEYAPNAVKKAIVGAGHAEKQQIRLMVTVLMPKATFATDDAADALAIALTHAHHRGSATARIAAASAAQAPPVRRQGVTRRP
jgi:crossover junction endodeoxyribonuclease RuvC